MGTPKFVAFPGSVEGADNARSGSGPSLQKQHGLRGVSLPLLSFCLSVRTRQSSPAVRESSAQQEEEDGESLTEKPLSATKNNKLSTFLVWTLLDRHGWSERTQQICQVPPAPSPTRLHRQQIKNQIHRTYTVTLFYGHFSRVPENPIKNFPENPIKNFPEKAGEQPPHKRTGL